MTTEYLNPPLAFVRAEPHGVIAEWSVGKPDDLKLHNKGGDWHIIPDDDEGKRLFAALQKHSPFARCTASGDIIKTISADQEAAERARKAAIAKDNDRECNAKVITAENLCAIANAIDFLLAHYRDRPLDKAEETTLANFDDAKKRIDKAFADRTAKNAAT